MVENYYDAYREFLSPGSRIEVGIPLSGGGVFRDWAVVGEFQGDELLVQISRDVLPAEVHIDQGYILDVSIRIKNELYTCSGIIVHKQSEKVLRIRLFGPFTLKERRQFFRINLDLRIKYAIIKEAAYGSVEADWKQRREIEQMKFQGFDEVVIAAHRARYRPTVPLEWRDLPNWEVNLGGGGLALLLAHHAYPDDLVAMEIHLPLSPPRLIHTVARVIHVIPAKVRGKAGCRAGMSFVMLAEHDRDLLFQHISATQMAFLRDRADRRDFGFAEPPPPEPLTKREKAVRGILVVAVFLVTVFLVRKCVDYIKQGPPNEIQQTYQKSLKQYRHEDH
ncbi:hypothetical protein GMSM_15840 [Geomonas sp. Red276]